MTLFGSIKKQVHASTSPIPHMTKIRISHQVKEVSTDPPVLGLEGRSGVIDGDSVGGTGPLGVCDDVGTMTLVLLVYIVH